MPTYAARKIKTFLGREGHGFNAELLKDGQPVAFVMNAADGGPYDIEWYDRSNPKVEVTNPENGHKYRVSPEEAALLDHTKDMVFDMLGHDRKPLHMGIDGYIEELVLAQTERKRLERACKTKTAFRLKAQRKGDYYTLNTPYTPQVHAHLVSKYGDQLEIVYNAVA
jgi:uncharacterized protein YodC (DUF2158 family)